MNECVSLETNFGHAIQCNEIQINKGKAHLPVQSENQKRKSITTFTSGAKTRQTMK